MDDRKETTSFYKEMDEKSGRKSFCTCQTLVIFFIVLFLLGAGLIWRAYKKVSAPAKPKEIVTPTMVSEDTLKKKLEQITQTPTQSQVTIELTNQELTSLLNEFLSAQPNLNIKGAQAQIQPTGVVFAGRLTSPIETDVQVVTQPFVEEGKVRFRIEKVSAGTLGLPEFATKQLSDVLSQALKNIDQKLVGVTVQNVELRQGVLVVRGTKK